VTTVGPGWGIAWDSVTFVVAAVLFSRLPHPPVLPDHHRRRWDRRWAGELADGVRALTGRTWLWTTTLADCPAGREHIAYEETSVWPELRKALSAEEADDLGTRPHPHTPPKPGLLKTAGRAIAAADRVRDAVTGRGKG
jgi:hypothetical protein